MLVRTVFGSVREPPGKEMQVLAIKSEVNMHRNGKIQRDMDGARRVFTIVLKIDPTPLYEWGDLWDSLFKYRTLPGIGPLEISRSGNANKAPLRDRDMEDTSCHLLWQPEAEARAVWTLIPGLKHQLCTSRHQHAELWCSEVCEVWTSSEMGEITMSWDRKEGKWKIPYANQKGHCEGLMKQATPGDFRHHLMEEYISLDCL